MRSPGLSSAFLLASGLLFACGGAVDPGADFASATGAMDEGCTNDDCPPDPGCTNEDCPPDPGCTNEDCPPDYAEGCCCYMGDYEPGGDEQRLCCCKEGNDVTCRLSDVIDTAHHVNPVDVALTMGEVPSESGGECAPPAFLTDYDPALWPRGVGCGWLKQLHRCGPVISSAP